MLSGIFHKRRKIQELRSPALQDIKKFRDVYARHAERRHSVYKAISCQKELHVVDFRQEDITDPQLVALAETLVEMPMISYLDLRDNRITDDGAKALLEVLRLQVIAAKSPLKLDPKTKLPIIPSVPEYTRYVTHVNVKGNEISAGVLQELAQYTEILKREDKRVEIRAALAQIDRNTAGGIDEDEFKAVLKLLTGAEPSRKELKALMQQHTHSSDSLQKSAVNLENLLLAKCSSASPSKKAACPPWEALVQVRHATLGQLAKAKSEYVEHTRAPEAVAASAAMHRSQSQQLPPTTAAAAAAPSVQISTMKNGSGGGVPVASEPTGGTAAHAAATMLSPPQPTPPMQLSPVSSSGSADHGTNAQAKLTTEFKPPASPPPPLPLPHPIAVPPANLDARAAAPRSVQISTSASRELHESPIDTTRGPTPSSNSVDSARGASSPDRASVHSSTSSFSVCSSDHAENARHPPPPPAPASLSSSRGGDDAERKRAPATASGANLTVSESPRWRDDDIVIDDDEVDESGSSGDGDTSGLHGQFAEEEEETRTKSMPRDNDTTLNESSRHSGQVRRVDSGTFASEVVELSDGEGDFAHSFRNASGSLADACSSKDKDLTSLIYRANDDAADGGARRQGSRSLDRVGSGDLSRQGPQVTSDDDDDDDDDDAVGSDERVDSTVADVTVDGKPRSVASALHSGFRRGVLLKDFPGGLPFRNLVALTLSGNAISSLALLRECRCPCAKVLDVSKNRLTSIADADLAGFPKLQVLDLAHNRLRSVQGLGHVFELRALNASHNALKAVKNIEHLAQLQMLNVAHNFIASSSTLRPLSLNKMVTHLDLDGNPVVATDERQKRKNIVYILNLMPMLLSLGSVACASLSSKEKKSKSSGAAQVTQAAAARGRALFDVDGMFPAFKELWTTHACELVQCLQDAQAPTKNRGGDSTDDDDEQWGTSGTGDWDTAHSDTRPPKRPLNKQQQRQKDELRSRAVGYRSREKALPSPPKLKASAYAFGPPLPPPSSKKTVKKAPPAHPSVVKQQRRRASELSAPKHQPVDTRLLSQEQKRKSRPMFDVNMSVAERLLLAQEKAQRRPTTSASKRLSSTGATKVAAIHTKHETCPAEPTTSPMPRSPEQGNQEVVAFRIEPLPSSSASPSRSSAERANQVDLDGQVPPLTIADSADTVLSRSQPASPVSKAPSSPHKPDSKPGKESSIFLQDLAVTDFLNHADEELSTALTALNVLLAMSEREMADAKKLAGYRSSLEALDILDERESHELYAKIREYTEHTKRAECAEKFERLGAVKRGMRQLLQKLETHAPGSEAVCACCRSLRANDLHGILEPVSDGGSVADEAPDQRDDSSASKGIEQEREAPPTTTPSRTGSTSSTFDIDVSEHGRVNAHDEASASNLSEDDPWSPPESSTKVPETPTPASVTVGQQSPPPPNNETASDDIDDEFDFLSSSTTVFDDDAATAIDNHSAAPPLDFEDVSVTPSQPPAPTYSPTAAEYVVSTDITADLQHNEDHTALADEGETPADATLTESDDLGDLLAATEVIEDAMEDELHEDEWLATEEATEDAAIEDGAENDTGVTDDDAWLTTEPSALDALDDDGNEGVTVVGTALQDEEERADETQSDGFETDAPFDVAEAPDDREPGAEQVSCEEPEEQTGSDPENHDGEAVGDDDAEPVEQEVQEDANPLSEGEDADDEAAEMFGDWEKGFDPNTNHYFWFNHETGESTWTPPEGWPYEVDTPFETGDGDNSAEGEDANYVAGDSDLANTGGADADEQGEADGGDDREPSEWELEGEHSALESSHRPLDSEVDDDLFSDQDLPSF